MSHPIDIHVGKMIKHRRNMIGMSQEELGKALGITFQQVQKYEQGKNRVSCSRLWCIAKVLKVPASFFFDRSEGASERYEDFPTREEMAVLNNLRKMPQQAKRAFISLTSECGAVYGQ